jgi:hypothetical protein
VSKLKLTGGGLLWKRVERAFADLGITFNKGRVAKLLRTTLAGMENADALPAETRPLAVKLVAAIRAAVPGQPPAKPGKAAARVAKPRGKPAK